MGIPYGYCHCGCGQKTNVIPMTSHKRGRIAGEPNRFISQHHMRIMEPEYVVEDRGYKTPCWIWQRSLTDGGYGGVRRKGESTKAHVMYYENKYGPVPDGLVLDHLCRVRACINPDHTEPVTRKINSWRGAKAKLTIEQVRLIKAHIVEGKMRCTDIAPLFGCTVQTVYHIKSGRVWSEG